MYEDGRTLAEYTSVLTCDWTLVSQNVESLTRVAYPSLSIGCPDRDGPHLCRRTCPNFWSSDD